MKADERIENALGVFDLWIVSDAFQLDHVRRRNDLSIPFDHVFSRDGIGSAVRGTSVTIRRLQSGSIRAYAGSLFFGVILILGWYLLR